MTTLMAFSFVTGLLFGGTTGGIATVAATAESESLSGDLAAGNDAEVDTGEPVKAADLDVLQKLHDANQTEIQMGHLAEEKGSTKAVKAFGRKLVTDHTAADKKLADYLKRHRLDLSALATTSSADAAHKATADQAGPEFDRTFAAQMVADHQQAIDLVQAARRNTGDVELRAMYGDLLPMLQAHKRQAQDLGEGRRRA